jgi:hypothetical protein
MLTEEISDVEAVPAGPVVVGLLAGRRLPPPPRFAADGEHPRGGRGGGDGAGENEAGSNSREHEGGHGAINERMAQRFLGPGLDSFSLVSSVRGGGEELI